MTVVIAVCISLLAAVSFFLIARGKAPSIASVDDLERAAIPIDILAFRNLVSLEEEEFIRRYLSPADFRRIRRKRALAAQAYLNAVARNASYIMRFVATQYAGSAYTDDGATRTLVRQATYLRVLCLLAMVKLRIGIYLPNKLTSLMVVSTQYDLVLESAKYLMYSHDPALATKVAAALKSG